jgi:glycosyltransferase involved in cell wall biosynthesis
MRVIIVVPDLPINLAEIKGGVHSALLNLLKGFSNQSITVRVLSFNRNVAATNIVDFSNNVQIYYEPESKLPHVFNYFIKGNAILKNHIKEFNPNLVHYAMSGYILVTKLLGLLGKKNLVTIHGLAIPEARLRKKIKDKLVFYTNGIVETLLNPNNIIHLSNYTLEIIGKTKHYAIIPNAIDPSFFSLTPKPAAQNKLLYSGVIDRNKNLIFLLMALNELVKNNQLFTLDVLGGFGDDKYKKEIEDFVTKNNLQSFIIFHGWVTQTTVKQYLQQADILVVSSQQESLPMVIAEAMCAGKVVVASNVGGISSMIKNEENGYIFNNNNPINLSTILANLYNNNNVIHSIQSKAAVDGKNTYECNMVAKRTIDFYNQL